MQPWAETLLIACAVVLTLAVLAVALALRRALRRVDLVLAIVEQELRPLVGQVQGLTGELRELTREATHEVVRIVEVTDHVNTAAHGLSRLVVALSGLARAGQIVGLAAGLRRGVDVFVSRLRRDEGDNSNGK